MRRSASIDTNLPTCQHRRWNYRKHACQRRSRMIEQEEMVVDDLVEERDSAVGDPVNHARIIATTLDGLVRSCRAGSTSCEAISDRLLTRWRQNREVVLRLDGVQLLSGDEVVLAAEEDEGSWLLPAFMAGMRSISLGLSTDVEDAVRLAAELGALGPRLPAIRGFRDWVWADGAEGFDVVLDFGFAEGLDAALLDREKERDRLTAIRAEALSAMSPDAATIASQDLDAAAARDEFQVICDLYAENVAGDSFAISREAAAKLRDQCDDSFFWIDAQVNLAFAYPRLGSDIPPQRMARRVLLLLEDGAVLRFLGYLAALRHRREDYVTELLQALETEEVGAVLADKLSLTIHERETLSTLLAGPPSPLTRELVCRLVERSVEDQQSLQNLAHLIMATGFDVFFGKLDVSRLSPRAVTVLGKLLQACRAPVTVLSGLIARSGPEAGLKLTLGLPPESLWLMRRSVLARFPSAHPREAHALLKVLLTDRTNDWARCLGEMVMRSHGTDLPFPVMRTLCKLFAHKGLCREYLAPLVLSREASDEVKLAAMRYVERDPDALEEVSSARLGGLFQSREVRQRIREALRRWEAEE